MSLFCQGCSLLKQLLLIREDQMCANFKKKRFKKNHRSFGAAIDAREPNSSSNTNSREH